jgi:hypothetical protein
MLTAFLVACATDALAEPALGTLPAPATDALASPPTAPAAAPAPTEALTEETGDEAEGEGVGVNIELLYATAYVFRGLNLFQDTRQLDPHMLLAPTISWSIADTGLTLGYWSAYQITGQNIGDNVDAGVNVEQDLYVTFDLELPHDMALAFSFQGYLYPAADPAVAEATMPTYLEPGVAFTYASVVDLGVALSYLAGVQDTPSISDYRYLYINPRVGKSFELSDEVGLELAAGYGFKYFNTGNEGRDNIHDLLLSAALPVHPGGGIAYVTPGLAAAWTNIEEVPDGETEAVVVDGTFADGVVVWGSLAFGMDL